MLKVVLYAAAFLATRISCYTWLRLAIAELAAGRGITVSPKGNSMTPKIRSGATMRLEPIPDPAQLKKGDVVFVKVNGNHYVHLITSARPDQVQISNNHGHVNGWVLRESVYGIVTDIDNSK